MRDYRPAPLGESWFDWVETSPGRIDPSSGELVETTVLPEDERKGMFDWVETSAGRINPRTGKLRVPTTLSPEAREKLKASGRGDLPGRGPSRFGGKRPDSAQGSHFTPRSQRDLTEWRPGDSMNGRGYGVGCGCNEMGESQEGSGPGAILWLFLGVTGLIALEVLGVTKISKGAST